MKRKHVYLAMLALIALLLIASLPRIYEIQSVNAAEMSDYPVLQTAYTDLCEQYSLYEVKTEDTIHIVTIKNLWGSWHRYILPCYSVYLPDIPRAGSVDSHAALYVLAPWSEENIFTNLFRLKVRDFSLCMEPGENLFVYSFAEVTHANMYPVRHIVDSGYISFEDAVVCNRLPTVWVDYAVATNNSASQRDEPVTTEFIWEYSLRFMGRKIRTGSYSLQMDHMVNA